MTKKATALSLFNRSTIVNHTPDSCGVYYLRGIADEESLYPVYYIGVAKRNELRQKLLEHFLDEAWTEVIYFNYVECSDPKEAEVIAKNEIEKHKPKFNILTVHPHGTITMKKFFYHN